MPPDLANRDSVGELLDSRWQDLRVHQQTMVQES